MASTKYIIAEQVLLMIQGGYPDTASPVKLPDIIKALEQKINADFKMQHFTQTLQGGDTTIPEAAMIATYENVAVTNYNTFKSQATLPVMPISLPRNMGVWEVFDPNYPENLFIPLLPQQANLLRSQKLINDLLGQVGYTPNGRKVIFTIDLPILGISVVTMRLLVMDFSTYTDTDILPLPPDYESNLVDYLVKKFAPVQQGDKLVDVYTEPQQPMKQ